MPVVSFISTSPVLPVIEISLASPEEPQPEPYSPFTPLNYSFPSVSDSRDMDDDSYRPTLLTPPVQSWSLSPLRPFNERRPGASPGAAGAGTGAVRPKGQGLKDEEFQTLLRASKERSAAAATAASKRMDLRKEVALKAHKNKQLERRALFLSKIGAPPSPTAISQPKTPPDSPAIFHYTLPSPGLCSPLALFEKLELDNQDPDHRGARKVWVEQVDFRFAKNQAEQLRGPRPPVEIELSDDDEEETPMPTRAPTPRITVTTPDCTVAQPAPVPPKRGHARKRSIPSLEEITERYSAQAQAQSVQNLIEGTQTAAPTPTRARAPFLAFLNARRQTPSPPLPNEVPAVTVIAPESASLRTRPRLACTGRIQFPSRSPSPPSPSSTCKPLPSLPAESEFDSMVAKRMNALPSLPMSPISPCVPSLEITTTHVPRTESTSPAQLTEANLHALNSRALTAREMLNAIRRRTAVSQGRVYPPPSTPPAWRSSCSATTVLDEEKQRRRHSAPAELRAQAKRVGFVHPVLLQPGGF